MKGTTILLAASMAVLLAACGKQEAPPPPAAAPAAAPAAPAAPAAAPAAPAAAPAAPAAAPAPTASAAGQSVYNRTCALCHAAGVAGAPKPGDKAEWEPRIAQGVDVMYKHAIEGFTGSKGMMPPRGGASNLSDEEVKAAVDFMVEKSQ